MLCCYTWLIMSSFTEAHVLFCARDTLMTQMEDFVAIGRNWILKNRVKKRMKIKVFRSASCEMPPPPRSGPG